MAALKRDKTLAELAQQFDVHPNQTPDWKDPLMERAAQVLGDGSAPARTDPDLTKLHAMLSEKKSGQEQLLPALLTLVRRHATQQEHLINATCGPAILTCSCDDVRRRAQTTQYPATQEHLAQE